MGIMNAAVRNAIKVALAKKYLDSLGLKIPSLPQRPKFELPPMPDLASMYSDIANTGNMTGLSELYTEEYKSWLRSTTARWNARKASMIPKWRT